ncbi:AAA family ATPase [Synechococcus elongatus]|uniref:AAA family ATPase n=1 Tax=Synechococcus elongatus TaxID=32046 RepID=UPI0030CC2D23
MRLLISSTSSGAGKTAIAQALQAYQAWRRQPVWPCQDWLSSEQSLAERWQSLQQNEACFLEAPGCLGTLVAPELTVADLAQAWRLPVLLVASGQMDWPGQAIAMAALAQQRQLPLLGVILNQVTTADRVAQESFQLLTGIPVLGTFPKGAAQAAIAEQAAIVRNWELEHLPGFLPAIATV